ncbi:transcriptional repressor CTCF isoform X2 [Drosophila innubila]|nr:transcriptional repressor CTCF isoform X2 [Drosophila innubila]
MPNRKRDSDSEDLQSFLMNFHKEIEDGNSEARNAKDLNAKDVDDEEKEEENEEEDDDDKYFIDDEGNCYIKTTPKKKLKLTNKLKPPVVSKPAAITVRSATRSSTTNASKAINLRPVKPKLESSPQRNQKSEPTPQRSQKAEPTPKTSQNRTRNKTPSTPTAPVTAPKAYLRSQRKAAKPESKAVELLVDNEEIIEELVDDPMIVNEKESDVNQTKDSITLDDSMLGKNSICDDEVFEFEDNAANMSAKPDVDFVLSGKEYKLKTLPTQSADSHKYACSHCSYTTNKKFLISRHVRSHDAELSFKCSICDRGFKSNMGLVNHLNTHMGNKPHKCKQCESAFTTSGELIRHTRYKHTKEKPHKCTECSYASVELTKLRRHMTCHTGERPYQCPHCTYASQDMFKLKRHLVIHTGEKKYQCDICKSRFTQSNSLKAHKLIHSVVDKPVFQCSLCPTTCGRKADLRTHMANMHTSDKPLVCKRCKQELPDRYQYKLHVKSHEGEKCYRCTLCSYASVSQRHLDSHMRIHTDTKPFTCDLCPQAFRQHQLLRRHKNVMHNEHYKPPEPREKLHSCPSCPRIFTHKGNLMRHMETHDDTLNAREEKLKLKLGRNVRLQPDGSIVTLVNSKEIDILEKNEDISIDLDEQYDITELEQLEDDDEDDEIQSEDIVEPMPSSTPRTRNASNTVVIRERSQRTQNKPIIINRQLKVPRGHRGVTTQAGTFRIKEEPDANEFTVELQGEDNQFMVVQLVDDDNEVVVKREPSTQKITANNCFGFEDDADTVYEEYDESVTEVDGTSQEFMHLMDMIEQDT